MDHDWPANLLQRQNDGVAVKPACGSTGKQGSYNVPAHVIAVFLIFVISTLGRTRRLLASSSAYRM